MVRWLQGSKPASARWTLEGLRLTELCTDAFNHVIPLPWATLPKQTHAGVPESLLSLHSPSPIGHGFEQQPGGYSHAACEMGHSGAAGDDQIAVIDNRTVITGSFNWSPSAAHQNDEVLLVIESPLLAAHFTREMDRLWRGAELGINERLARKLAANRRRCGSGVRREIKGG